MERKFNKIILTMASLFVFQAFADLGNPACGWVDMYPADNPDAPSPQAVIQRRSPSAAISAANLVSSTVNPLTSVPTTGNEVGVNIAVSPVNPQHIVIATSDYSSPGGYSSTVYLVSMDGGQTWASNTLPMQTSDGYSWEARTNGTVAIDSYENVFIADGAFNTTNCSNGLYLSVGSFSAGTNLGISSQSNIPLWVGSSVLQVADLPSISLFTNPGNQNGTPQTTDLFLGFTLFDRYQQQSNGLIYSLNYSDQNYNQLQTFANGQYGILGNGSFIADNNIGGVKVQAIGIGYVAVAYESFDHGGTRNIQVDLLNPDDVDWEYGYDSSKKFAPFHEIDFTSNYAKNSYPVLSGYPPTETQLGKLIVAWPEKFDNAHPSQIVMSETSIKFIPILYNRVTGNIIYPNHYQFFTGPAHRVYESRGAQFLPETGFDASGLPIVTWLETLPENSGILNVYASRALNPAGHFLPPILLNQNSYNVSGLSWIGNSMALLPNVNNNPFIGWALGNLETIFLE